METSSNGEEKYYSYSRVSSSSFQNFILICQFRFVLTSILFSEQNISVTSKKYVWEKNKNTETKSKVSFAVRILILAKMTLRKTKQLSLLVLVAEFFKLVWDFQIFSGIHNEVLKIFRNYSIWTRTWAVLKREHKSVPSASKSFLRKSIWG